MKLGLENSQIPMLEVSKLTISNLIGNSRLLGPIGGGQGSHTGLLSKASSSLVSNTSLGEPKTFKAKEDKILATNFVSIIY
jgi:hypothetical protein